MDGPEIAPMASRLSCHSCNELQPMVQEVANAVAELDENVQAYCNRPVTRVCRNARVLTPTHICGVIVAIAIVGTISANLLLADR